MQTRQCCCWGSNPSPLEAQVQLQQPPGQAASQLLSFTAHWRGLSSVGKCPTYAQGEDWPQAGEQKQPALGLT